MSTLRAYRDDGPLAGLAAQIAAAAPLPLGPLALTVAGAAPLLAVLVAARGEPPAAGLAAVAVLIAAGGAAATRAERGRLAWAVPPLLRALEYGVLIRLTALADPGAMAACYALLAVLAFHHYDAVYRLRHQKLPPPAWVRLAALGWDGRLLILYALAAAGGLGAGLVAGAGALALLFGGESVASWLRFARAEARTVYADEDVEAA